MNDEIIVCPTPNYQTKNSSTGISKNKEPGKWLPPRDVIWPTLNKNAALSVIPRYILKLNSIVIRKENEKPISPAGMMILTSLIMFRRDNTTRSEIRPRKLATICGIRPSTVQTVLTDLVKRGLIRIYESEKENGWPICDFEPLIDTINRSIANRMVQKKSRVETDRSQNMSEKADCNLKNAVQMNNDEDDQQPGLSAPTSSKDEIFRKIETLGRFAWPAEPPFEKNPSPAIRLINRATPDPRIGRRIFIDSTETDILSTIAEKQCENKENSPCYSLVFSKRKIQIRADNNDQAMGISCILIEKYIRQGRVKARCYLYNKKREIIAIITPSKSTYADPARTLWITTKIPEKIPACNLIATASLRKNIW